MVAMSGRILQEVSANLTPSYEHQDLPILVTHGAHDSKLPVHHARASKAVLESFPVDLTYREYPTGHELSETSLHDAGVWLRRHRQALVSTTKGIQWQFQISECVTMMERKF